MKYVNITKNPLPEPKKTVSKRKVISIMLGLVLTGVVLFLFRNDVMALFNPVSIISTIETVDLEETDGRTNILVLGSDKRSVGTVDSVLTDTILVASIGRVEKDVVLISLPRDLWIKSPTDYFSKINEVYYNGGADEMTEVVEGVLGIPIHYYAVVDFQLFKEAVDTLGGIEVNVETAFTDTQYPVEGKEHIESERYQTVTFEKGLQTMDGETALKFARSRKGNNLEGTDFARSARQQKVIMAIKDKALSLETIINPAKLNELYQAYANNVDTNITFEEITNFYLLSQQISFDNIESIVLDDRSASEEGGLLYSPEDTSLYGGAYVLLPKAGDFSQLHAYVQRYIFGEKN